LNRIQHPFATATTQRVEAASVGVPSIKNGEISHGVRVAVMLMLMDDAV